jgi:hypothetical protein
MVAPTDGPAQRRGGARGRPRRTVGASAAKGIIRAGAPESPDPVGAKVRPGRRGAKPQPDYSVYRP